MYHRTTQLPHLEVSLTAHQDPSGAMLLATFKAPEDSETPERAPIRVALVIDRSGSMAGEKLAITRSAVARFVRSLEPEDRVAIITFDDSVQLVSGLVPPSEALAAKVEAITDGGSTDLYGGWVTGAKIAGYGGRVILLSDGQANVGRFTDADSLAKHASISYEKYGVTTTTIGVGQDYDEALMAGIARSGFGAHYFAHTASAIEQAFSQERYSTGSVVIERLSIRCNGFTEQLGHFWAGETKRRILRLKSSQVLSASVRFTLRDSGQRATHELELPKEFGYSDEVRLESFLQQAAELEDRMVEVRDPRRAGEMREQLRSLVLDILTHPASDEPHVRVAVDRLRASIERLERLERNYVEDEAIMHRKRSLQTSYNMRERAKAFSSFADESHEVVADAMAAAPTSVRVRADVDPSAFALAPRQKWLDWMALPIEFTERTLTVAMEDPRRGFVQKEIERATGRRVRAVFASLTAAEIRDRLNAA